MPATAAAFSAVSAKPGAAACARSTKRATEATRTSSSGPGSRARSGRGSGATPNSLSPEMCRAVRLVTSIFSRGAPPSSAASAGAASVTCSKLSRRSSGSPETSRLSSFAKASAPSTPPAASSPKASATWGITRAGSWVAARDAKHTLSLKSPRRSSASCSARRVFPVPPGPVRVSRRTSGRRRRALSTARSASRPMSEVRGVGSGVSRKADERRRPDSSSPRSEASSRASSRVEP